MIYVAKKCVQIIAQVIKRFVHHNDHGVYPTIVEETLRAFYLANAGGAVWNAMKKETQDTFGRQEGGTIRGGRYFLDQLAKRIGNGPGPRITLVGHSTGAVFIGEFLRNVASLPDPGWRDTAKFRIVLEAPAATYTHFAGTLKAAESQISDFLMFTMDDRHEQADHLLGPLYPRSLLYLVSGLLERDANGDSSVEPLVGLARYLQPAPVIPGEVADFLSQPGHVVYSPSPADAPAGARSAADRHSEFDDDPLLLASLATFLAWP